MYEDTLKLILSLAGRKPAPSLAPRLDALFRDLARARGPAEASRVEELIWAAWMSHADPAAEAELERATLYFRLGRDAESVRDIQRTLALEPRHFGAICGFGQICLRKGDRAGALFAFDAALRIDPHLGAVRAAFEELVAEAQRTAH